MLSTKLKALFFSALVLILAGGAAGDDSTVSTQCRLLQTSMSSTRLAVIGDCRTNEGDYVVTYLYPWHCMTVDDNGAIQKGASNSQYILSNSCDQCGIVGPTGFACHCVTNGWGTYRWSNSLNIDEIFALDGIGNMMCR